MTNITKFYGISGWARNLVSSLTILALLITSAGSLLAFPQDAQAANTGFVSAGGTESPNEWSNPTNAFSSNNSYATEDDDGDDQGYNTFNFPAIAPGSLIEGIEVTLEAFSSVSLQSVFTDTFGTGNDSNDISGWEEEGTENDSTTLARNAQNSGDEDEFSPSDPDSSGRFAKIGQDEWICRAVTTSGLSGLVLEYFWKGDNQGEDGLDFGYVEYSSTGTCDSGASWTTVATHELDDGVDGGSAWSTEQSVSVPNGITLVRFRQDSSDADEHFRVDGVSLIGTPSNSSCEIEVRIGDSGSFTGYKTAVLTGTEQTFTLGNAGDLWGGTWDSDSFTNGNFDLEIQYDDTGAACHDSALANLDNIQARVHYTAALPVDYYVTGSANVVGTTLNLSGTSGANPQKGADGTQHMAVDWDEDQDGDPDTGTGWEVAPAGGLVFTPEFSGSNPNRTFTDNWTATHNYTNSGPHTVSVMVYHGNTPGQDGDALSTISFDVVIPPPSATISATKIVCDSEADLPNMSGGANITATTASTFLAANSTNCRLQSGWIFEWAPSSSVNPGNNLGAAGGSWSAFGPTNASGIATVQIPAGSDVWVREQMQANYLPFSGDTSAPLDNNSAEIYCSADVENYDNYDRISSPAGATTYHCVAFNALPAPTLTVVKTVTNDNGGTLGVANFPLFIDGTPVVSGATTTVTVGAHTVSETNSPGYAATFGGACAPNGSVTLAAGESKICTINNNDIQPTLTVTKSFTNDNGGTITDPSLFTYLVDLEQVLSGIQEFFNIGTYTISEQGNNGYTPTFGGDCVGGTVTLAIGDAKNCTIVNNDNAPSLTLTKIVSGGSALASDFTLTATGNQVVPTVLSGAGSVMSDGTFKAGTYTLTENYTGALPNYYVAGAWSCIGGTQTGDTVALTPGQSASCSITNTYTPPACDDDIDNDGDGQTDASDPGCWTVITDSGTYDPSRTSEGNESTLATCTDLLDNDGDTLFDLDDPSCGAYVPKVVVHKTVVNDNLGGTATASQFSVDIVNGANTFSNLFFTVDGTILPVGSVGTVNQNLAVGSYSVTEDPFSGYTQTMTGDCSGTVSAGQTKHCYFTNDDQATTVLVKKVLVNDSGKTNATTTFSVKNNGGASSFFNEIGEVLFSITPGSFSVLEDVGTNAGYTVGHEGCSGSLTLGQTATCVITNNDKPACNDGLDNDVPADGLMDEDDPGCYVDNGDGGTMYDENGQSEGNETTLAMCKDYADNDGDSLVDLADPDCAAFKPILIVKKVLSYEGEIPATSFGIFNFSLDGGTSQAFDSEDGMNTLILDTKGTHTVEEVNLPQNWDFGSVSCSYEDDSEGDILQEGNGYEFYAAVGKTVTCTFTNVWNPKFDCSDGLDNDGDGNTDASDPGCHLDNDPNNPNSYAPTADNEVNNPGNGGGGGGGSGGADPQLFSNGGSGPFVLGASTGPGQVLGDTCGLYMDKYLRRGNAKNDKSQTEKLQAFLNKWVGANLPLTGFFGPLTEEAVKAYQSSNPDSILKPWNLTSATGLVYITTLRQMNLQECPALTLEIPELNPWTDN